MISLNNFYSIQPIFCSDQQKHFTPCNTTYPIFLKKGKIMSFCYRETMVYSLHQTTHTPLNCSLLYAANFAPLFRDVSSLTDQLSRSRTDLSGQDEHTKMSILPKLLYLFETLPVAVPKSQLHSTVSQTLAGVTKDLEQEDPFFYPLELEGHWVHQI